MSDTRDHFDLSLFFIIYQGYRGEAEYETIMNKINLIETINGDYKWLLKSMMMIAHDDTREVVVAKAIIRINTYIY